MLLLAPSLGESDLHLAVVATLPDVPEVEESTEVFISDEGDNPPQAEVEPVMMRGVKVFPPDWEAQLWSILA